MILEHPGWLYHGGCHGVTSYSSHYIPTEEIHAKYVHHTVMNKNVTHLLLRCLMWADSREFMCMYFIDITHSCSVILCSSNATFYHFMFVLLCLILLSQQFPSKPWIIELYFRDNV